MSDIVKVLRSAGLAYGMGTLPLDAADEIERLRAEIENVKGPQFTKRCDRINQHWGKEVERLRAALRGLLDCVGDEPCNFDHHGYCQAHFVTEPCEVLLARKALEGKHE